MEGYVEQGLGHVEELYRFGILGLEKAESEPRVWRIKSLKCERGNLRVREISVPVDKEQNPFYIDSRNLKTMN
jgi:hypothetical protein